MFHHSLRFRLTCWYSAVLAVVLVIFSGVLYGAVRHQSLHHHDDSLQLAAQSVMSILGRRPDCATLTADQIADLGRLDRLVLVHDLAGTGEVFYRTPDLDPALLPRNEAEFRRLLSQPESFETLETSAGALRIYSVRYTTQKGRQGVVRVMDSLGNVQEALEILGWALVLLVPLSLLVAGGGGYWLAGRALRPVDAVTRLAHEIEATNLTLRLPTPRTSDELGRLVKTFNQMIGRLETSFEAMRQFTADASHELRTPLTIMRGAIEVALGRERTPEEYRQTLGNLLEEVERMTRLVEDLLLLARADAGNQDILQEPVRLDEIAAEVVESMQPLADSGKVALSLDPSTSVESVGDDRWLRQMLYNLVDNAIKHGGPGGTVRVTLETRSGSVLLNVADSGAGIPADAQPHLFERFYRADKARSRDNGGAGLGLSIALWIAKSHGGDIGVESRSPGGSIFTVVLPLGTHSPKSADPPKAVAT